MKYSIVSMTQHASGCAALICLCTSAFAADSISVQTHALSKISVTAARDERSLAEVPATVTIKDAEEIERELAADIKDLVRYEPGISVSNSPARFGQAGFNIRGIEGNRVLMRVGGVRMSDAFAIGSFSDARRNLVDLDVVRAVEIVRGPASALYGSDAIGGVVSFILKDAADFLAPDESFDVAANTRYRSADDGWSANARLATASDAFSALVLYGRDEGHETDNQGSNDALDRTRTTPNPQSIQSDSVMARLGWDPNDAHRLRLTLEAQRSGTQANVLSGVGVVGTVNTLSLRGDDTQERWIMGLDHEIFLESAMLESLELRAYGQRTEIDQRTVEQRLIVAAGPAATVERDRLFSFEQMHVGAELIAHKDFDLGTVLHRLAYGIDARQTRTEQLRDGTQRTFATGATTSNIAPDNFPVRDFPKTDTRELAVFAQDEIVIGEYWSIIPGVRVDSYKLDPKPDAIFVADNPGVSTAKISETSVSPKLGFIVTLADELSIYGNFARGFRAPPYNDVNIGFTNLAFGYTAIANEDLKPETSNGFELGARGTVGSGFYTVSTFHNEYDDFIESLVPIGMQGGLLVYQSQNLTSARIYGAEAQMGMPVGNTGSVLENWSIRSSVAWSRGVNRETDQPLNSVDPLKGVLGIAFDEAQGRWGAELIGTAVRRKTDVDQSAGPQFEAPGYVTVDVLAYANLQRLRLNLGVFNLLDRKYWEWSDVRGRPANDPVIDRYSRPGINARVSATYRF
jgi:hemoglobin/transferrin/lactoferrin receptor protein